MVQHWIGQIVLFVAVAAAVLWMPVAFTGYGIAAAQTTTTMSVDIVVYTLVVVGPAIGFVLAGLLIRRLLHGA